MISNSTKNSFQKWQKQMSISRTTFMTVRRLSLMKRKKSRSVPCLNAIENFRKILKSRKGILLSKCKFRAFRTRHKSSGASDRPPSASDSLKEENLSPRKPSKSSVSSVAFPGTPAQTPKQPTHPNQVTNMANLLRKNNVSERLSESPNNTSAWPSNQSGTSNQNLSTLDINKVSRINLIRRFSIFISKFVNPLL